MKENLLKDIKKLVLSSRYQFDFHNDNYGICYLIFFKTLCDLTDEICDTDAKCYEDLVLPCADAKNVGEALNERFDEIIDDLSNISSLKLPDFSKTDDRFLSEVVTLIAGYNFSKTSLFYDDVLSIVYEYMGLILFKKSPHLSYGEFLTPRSVCDLMTKLTIGDKEVKDGSTVCDPCCGTGSTLVSFIMTNWKYKVECYGQDINQNSVNICRLNILLHNIKAKVLREKRN